MDPWEVVLGLRVGIVGDAMQRSAELRLSSKQKQRSYSSRTHRASYKSYRPGMRPSTACSRQNVVLALLPLPAALGPPPPRAARHLRHFLQVLLSSVANDPVRNRPTVTPEDALGTITPAGGGVAARGPIVYHLRLVLVLLLVQEHELDGSLGGLGRS